MDIRAYNQRIESLKQKSDQLEDENFHDIETITKRYVFKLYGSSEIVCLLWRQRFSSRCRVKNGRSQ